MISVWRYIKPIISETPGSILWLIYENKEINGEEDNFILIDDINDKYRILNGGLLHFNSSGIPIKNEIFEKDLIKKILLEIEKINEKNNVKGKEKSNVKGKEKSNVKGKEKKHEEIMKKLFLTLQGWATEEYQAELGQIWLIDKKFLKEIGEINNDHIANLFELFDMLIHGLRDRMLWIYPESSLFNFILSLTSFSDFTWTKLFNLFIKNQLLSNKDKLNLILVLYHSTIDIFNPIENNINEKKNGYKEIYNKAENKGNEDKKTIIENEKWFFPLHISSNYDKIQLHVLELEKEFKSELLSEIEHFTRIRAIGKHFEKKYKDYGLKKKPQTIIFNIKRTIDLIKKIVETNLPYPPNRVRYLIEDTIHRTNRIGKDWHVFPYPTLLYGGFRGLLYNIGLRLNIRKLSPWAIADLSLYLLRTLFGEKGELLLLVPGALISREPNLEINNNGNESKVSIFLLEYKHGTVSNIKTIAYNVKIFEKKNNDNNVIESDTTGNKSTISKSKRSKTPQSNFIENEDVNSLIVEKISSIIKSNNLEKLDFYSLYSPTVVWFNPQIISEFYNMIIKGIYGSSFLSLNKVLKFIRFLQDPLTFNIWPLPEELKKFRNMKPMKILKNLSPIITDLNEF